MKFNTIFFSSKYRKSIPKTDDPRLKKHVTYVLNLLIYISTFGHIKLIPNDVTVKIMNNIKPNFMKILFQSILIDSGIGVDKAVRNVDVEDDDGFWDSSPSIFVDDAEPSVSLEPWEFPWIDVVIELVFSEPGLGTGFFSLK